MGLSCSLYNRPQILPIPSDDKDTVETENKVTADKVISIQLILQNENFYLSFIDFITLHGKEKLFIAYEELESLTKITPLPTTVSTISGKETRRIGNYNFQALLGTTHSLLTFYRKEQARMQRDDHESIVSPPHSFHMMLSRSNSSGGSNHFAILSHQNSNTSNQSGKSNRSGKSNANSMRSGNHQHHHHTHHNQSHQQHQKRKEFQEELIRKSLLPLLHYTQLDIQAEQLHTYIKECQLQLLAHFVPVLDEFVQSIEFQKLLTSISRSSISTNKLFQSLSKSYDATASGSSTSTSSYGTMGPGFIPQLRSSFDELAEGENETETIHVPATPTPKAGKGAGVGNFNAFPSGVLTDIPQHEHPLQEHGVQSEEHGMEEDGEGEEEGGGSKGEEEKEIEKGEEQE